MKTKINAIIVVEGKSDIDFLSSFIDAEIVSVNGSAVDSQVIQYLKQCSKDIIVMTDPDFPGKQIRDKLSKELPNAKHCFVKKEECIKNGKVGVAESNKSHILSCLNFALSLNSSVCGTLTMADLYELGITGNEESAELKNKINEKYHIGFCNSKTLLKRLNSLNISKEELIKL